MWVGVVLGVGAFGSKGDLSIEEEIGRESREASWNCKVAIRCAFSVVERYFVSNRREEGLRGRKRGVKGV